MSVISYIIGRFPTFWTVFNKTISPMKHFLTATALLLTVLTIAATAQQADELRQKYGTPDSYSRYIVRPDIGMTVEFAENGQSVSDID